MKIKTEQVPLEAQAYFTKDKPYDAEHISGNSYRIIDDNGNPKGVKLGTGCGHLNNRRWRVVR